MNKVPDWSLFRGHMPVAQRWAYFDHAAVAPISGPAQQTIFAWCNEAAEEGDTQWPNWARRVETVRVQAAELLGAQTEEIALVPNTTTGISFVAEGLDWQEGENVVFPDNEFPSNQYPWLHLADRGVVPRPVKTADAPLTVDRLLEACDDRTRLIGVSWVGYADGRRLDIAELVERAHAKNILVFLDAIQGLGMLPLDVSQTPVDFLAADGHKWLLGPEGAGIFYVRRDLLNQLRPLVVGWNSVASRHDFQQIELQLRSEAARYEAGTQNMVGMLGLGASLDLLLAHGARGGSSVISERMDEVTDELCRRVEEAGAVVKSDRSPAHKSAIVAIEIPGRDPAEVKRDCLGAGVVVNCRGGWIRLSPHAYCNSEDIDRLVAAITP